MQLLNTIVGCILVTGLTGCAGSKNVTLHGADYPTQQASPKQIVKITGSIPKEMDIAFEAVWAAGKTDANCLYYENNYLRFEGASIAFHVTEPLKVIRDNETYRTEVVADRFLPGECNWRLDRVTYKILRGDRELTKSWIIRQPGGKKEENGRVTVWCTKDISLPMKSIFLCSYWNEALRGKPQPEGVILLPTTTDVQFDIRYLD